MPAVPSHPSRRGAIAHHPLLIAWQVGAIVIAAWVIFSPALSGGWLWDDAAELSQNPEVKATGSLARIWLHPAHADYFPLKSTVQWIAWRLWGESAPAYRTLNLVLHVLSALLVWRLFARLRIPAAWFGGVLFAIHPLAVESVAWIAELKNTLSLPPLLLAACAYIDYDETGRRSRYAAALAWFLASLLCKTSGVMLPVVLLLYHGWKTGKITARNCRDALPFFAVSLVLGLVTIYFQHTRAIASVPVPIGGFGSRLAVAGVAAAFYAWKFILPLPLVPVYPRWEFNPPALWHFAPWVLLAVLLAICWRRRSTWGRHVLFGGGVFIVLVAPVLGFVAMSYMHYSWVADHFVYLPIIGLVGLTTGAVGRALSTDQRARRRGIQALAVVTVLALALLSRRHAAHFRDETALWTHTLQHNPHAAVAHDHLGAALQNAGRHAEAMGHFETAIARDPKFASPRNNLGVSLAALGRSAEAMAQFRGALQIDSDYVAARSNLANALAQGGHAEEAIAEYRAALRTRPAFSEARFNLANALYLGGHAEEALAELRRGLADRPGFAPGYDNAGKILVREGRTAESIPYYEMAVRLAPLEAAFHTDLGYALALSRRWKDAAAQFEEALRINPNSIDAHVNLGGVLYQNGDLKAATTQFEAALRIDPNSREARQNLNLIRQQTEGIKSPPP